MNLMETFWLGISYDIDQSTEIPNRLDLTIDCEADQV